MNQKQSDLLHALKRCRRFLADYGHRLGPLQKSPPARELGAAIDALEYCARVQDTGGIIGAETLRAGATKALAFVVRNARKVRRGLDVLVRPAISDDGVLSEEWDLASTIDPNSLRVRHIKRWRKR